MRSTKARFAVVPWDMALKFLTGRAPDSRREQVML
jgi:hypothetical protein